MVRTFRVSRRDVVRLVMVVALAVIVAAPPRPLVVLGPPQTVQSVNPKMGMHTRLTDEVEPWKIKRTLEMVREMGASSSTSRGPTPNPNPAPSTGRTPTW